MNLSSLFRPSSGDRRKKPMSPGQQMEHDSPHGSPQLQQKQHQEKRRWRTGRKPRTPKLERTNASSYIEYEPPRSSSDSHSYYDSPNSRSVGTATPRTRSLDLHQPYSGSHQDKTSFRIQGAGESEIVELCSSLGITGPEEFAVPVAEWNARKRASSDVLPRPAPFESVAEVPTRASRLLGEVLASGARSRSPSPTPSPSCCSPSCDAAAAVPVSSGSSRKADDEDGRQQRVPSSESRLCSTAADAGTAATSTSRLVASSERVKRGGIRGVRPPVLAPPPCSSPSHVVSAAVPVNSRSSRTTKADDQERRHSDVRLSPEPRRPDESQRLPSFGMKPCPTDADTAATSTSSFASSTEQVNRGIRGVRPPILSPPPSVPRVTDLGNTVSHWELLRSFAPQHHESDGQGDFQLPERRGASLCSDDDEGTLLQPKGARPDVTGEFTEEVTVPGLVSQPCDETTTAFNSFTTVDDDSSSTTTEGAYGISPNGRFRRNIYDWKPGRELGRGSFGIVYEAINYDGFFFAVKEVSLLDARDAQQSIMQLEQEIALLSQFEHDNIVQYLGTEKAENKLYIFLELVTQGSLASLYHKYDLRDSQVSAYTRQILHGLKYLHDQNIVHRDIKCANILVDANGSVKLADFGLAKQTKNTDMLKSCKGSVYWMAPEVVHPVKEYGWPADIWSLGCTVLEMLTRNPPYNIEWTRAFFMIGKGALPEIPESLSNDARDFIQKCLQVDPDRRPNALSLLKHPFVRTQVRSWGNDYSHGRRT